MKEISIWNTQHLDRVVQKSYHMAQNNQRRRQHHDDNNDVPQREAPPTPPPPPGYEETFDEAEESIEIGSEYDEHEALPGSDEEGRYVETPGP